MFSIKSGKTSICVRFTTMNRFNNGLKIYVKYEGMFEFSLMVFELHINFITFRHNISGVLVRVA